MTTIAAIQMISSHQVDENLKTADALVREASTNGAKLVLLPENFALMGMQEQDKLAIQESEGEGTLQQFLSDLARECGIYLIAGTIPLSSSEKDRVYSSSLLFDPNGDQLARYDKIHLFDVVVSEQEQHVESNSVMPGQEPISIDTPIAHCGLTVCYDLRFPELYRKLSAAGANLLSVPSAFTYITGKAHWEVLLRARAIENLCFVIAANQGGTHSNGRKTYGHSMIIDHWGKVLGCLESGEGVVMADVDLNAMQQKRESFPAMAHRQSHL